MSTIAPKESWCMAEGKILPTSAFYKSPNKLHRSGRLPYCKDCIEDMEKFYMKKYDNLEYVIYVLCALNDVPFIGKVYSEFEDLVMTSHRTNGYFYLYLSRLQNHINAQIRGEAKKRISFDLSDTQLNRFDNRQTGGEVLDERGMWGDRLSDKQIDYLETRWKTYVGGKELTPAQSQLYRNLCLAELDIWQGKEVDKAQKRQLENMKLLGLDRFNVDTSRTLEEQMIEQDIFIMEQNEPAEYYKDKEMYKDFRGIHASWTKEILRPVLNFITGSREYGIDNEAAEAWEKRADAIEGEGDDG